MSNRCQSDGLCYLGMGPVDNKFAQVQIMLYFFFAVQAISHCLNSLRPRQNGRNFADDTFKCFFFNEKVWISIKSSLKFVPKGPINNIPALLQIMAWRQPGDKPLSEPMMVSLLTHICVPRPWNELMAWCRQATSHLLNQSWPSTHSPYGITWPQWVLSNEFVKLCVETPKLTLCLTGRMWPFWTKCQSNRS